ncbi:MAG: hypothetical protein A2648_02085 [Candidatus Lloydbacteria bacterium RIFCSPHIGHO2_01_FULL_41_20]|uniref:D-alanyl-D-alanine carboxypeptidase-like core domain-containing protein n=1 Tax=Candidatus Lloydbacteria bacterium RIFCSPHIGHO2_01_FULL_41_20 TaxID=1798657 RepID=A0A1G2CR86_9BACT|nr:MAG: hypothetical protein A2648_02085 [Candidatus Lloydbacteria bacterium RIFCSPHIGHO2_01_FULL_41_20]
MKEFFERKISLRLFPLLLVTMAIAGLSYYGANSYYELKEDSADTYKELENLIEKFQMNLASTTKENRDLSDLLIILRARNADFENEVGLVRQKISTLEKLRETDPELLQKYSKVFFLNENYIPAELSLIEPDFLLNKNKPVQIHTKTRGYLENLIRAARADGVDLSVLSGYRSFGTQASLKSQYTVVYGSASSRFSADQGYSEHQLGTTLDFTTKKNGEILVGFDSTPAYKWLTNNAHVFGFVISYPKNNKYYIFEPWHWRFVGVYLATSLYEQGKYFYDMPQRDIDSYLIKIFD